MSDPSVGNHGWLVTFLISVLVFLGGVILGSFSVATKFWNIIHGKVSTEDMKVEMEKTETTRRECQTLHLGLLERVEKTVETQRRETNTNIGILHGKVDKTNSTLQEVLLIVKNNGGNHGADKSTRN